MSWRRSLSFRLALYLVAAQALAIGFLPLLGVFYFAAGVYRSPGDSWSHIAIDRAHQLLIESLRQHPDGSISISPTPAMQEYIARNPSFRFAAYDENTRIALPGSSVELTLVAADNDRFSVKMMQFYIKGDVNVDSFGWLRLSDTQYGQMLTALYNPGSGPPELLYYVLSPFVYYPGAYILNFGPVILFVALAAWLVVRRGLAPLRAAAQRVDRIDLNSLDRLVPPDEVPAEVAPFVEAVNQSLTRVKQSVEARSRFLANAAHELRTPITVLCARIDNPVEATFLADVKRDARRIKTLAEQLLSLSQISNIDGVIGQNIDLGKLVQTVVMDYLPLAVANRKDIELERPAEPIAVHCYSYAIERVVLNLVENACRATPEGGTVLVRVLHGATIEVVDHGEGVAIENREKIFEPFWRKSNAAPGAGLGLAISKEIVERHEGRISVTETPGGGATFRVTLPQAVEETPSKLEFRCEERDLDLVGGGKDR